jgi:surfeit locus 1 family protein
VNTPSHRASAAARVLPPIAALALAVLFTFLGFWQLDRAGQKRALEAAFQSGGEPVEITANAAPPLYRRISATGHFLGSRQFLIDNIVEDGRLGYYVITPLELVQGGPLLLVNRGWIPRQPDGELPDVSVEAGLRTVEGRAGRLPRVGLRPGSALDADGGWPRLATFPTVEDLAGALQRPALPFVLLADPDPAAGLVRRWEPRQAGPSRHLGYAFQWFALAVAVVVLTAVLYRRKRSGQ